MINLCVMYVIQLQTKEVLVRVIRMTNARFSYVPKIKIMLFKYLLIFYTLYKIIYKFFLSP